MNTDDVAIEKVTYFVLHVIYNHPKWEKSPGVSRYAMLYLEKTKKSLHLRNHYSQIKSP